MPPVFDQQLFAFREGEMPEHINRLPVGERDVKKFALIVEYVESGDFYAVATDIDDLETAQALATAHDAHAAADLTGTRHAHSEKIVHLIPPKKFYLQLRLKRT